MTARAVLLAVLSVTTALPQPKLTPLDEAGYRKVISANKGKVLIVDFWATWCKPCRAEMPRLAAMESRLKARGLKLLPISADEPEQESAAAKFLTDAKIAGPGYIRRASDDEKFINSVDPKWSGALPALFLYDKTGRKVKRFVGETPIEDLEAEIAKLL